MDVQELLQQYAAGHRKFVMAHLRGANLVGVTLARANLSRANLSGANLARADLTQANLVRANLSRANLQGAQLYGVNLRQANLLGAEVLLDELEPEAYAGAILPNGRRARLELLENSPEPPLSSTLAASGEGASLVMSQPSPTTSNPIDADVSTSIGRQRRDRSSQAKVPWRQLPWLRLVSWSTGYGFLSLFIFCMGAGAWAWLPLWLSSWIWLGQPFRLRLLPLLAAAATVLGTGLSWQGLGLGLALFGLGAVGLRLTDWAWPKALEVGGWLGGIGCLTVALVPLMLNRSLEVAGHSEAVTSTFPLALMVLLGIGLLAMGLPSYTRLSRLSFSLRRLTLSLTTAATLGLLMGGGIGWLALGFS